MGDRHHRNTHWVAILGPRKVGKTSLLLELSRRARDPDLVFVILDTFEHYPVTWEVFRVFALRTLDCFASKDIGASLESLSHSPTAYREALLRWEPAGRLKSPLRSWLIELVLQKASIELAREALRLPELLADVLGRRVVVAWDEFQELSALGAGRGGVDPFPMIRSIWQRHRRVSYFISGSARSMLTELVTSERSPFFQHFSLMELLPFSRSDSVDLLVSMAPDDRPVPRSVAEQAADIMGGHPFYLQLLGERLTSETPPYDEDVLKEALQMLLFSRTGRLALYFEQRFANLVGKAATLAAVLNALASGPCRLSELSRAIQSPAGATVRYIERLGEAVVREGDGTYRLADPTFGMWLSWRKPGGTVVPTSVIGDEAEQAVARHLAGLGFDLVYQSRASRGAFDLLALRGALQLGVQVKRTAMPLRFAPTEWKRMQAEAKRLGWLWVVAAVPPDDPDGPLFLSPKAARRGKEVRLTQDAAVENLLEWLDGQGDGRGSKAK